MKALPLGIWIALVLGIGSESALSQADSRPANVTPASSIDPNRVPDTLMFTVDELTDIQSRISARTEGGNARDNGSSVENATLYLSTIVYYGPQEWTIWVNGVPISPQQEFQAFQVTDIGPNFVELVVPLSAQGMRPVRLAPNQTFVAKSGAVVEGRWN